MSPAGSQSTVRDKRRKQRRTALFVLLAAGAASLLLAGCGAFDGDEGIPAFTPAELTALPEDEWITNGGTVYNQRYSPLDQLTPANVSDLKGVWRIQLDSATDAKYSGEAQPLIHDGVAYLSTGASDVFALDVDSGKTIWRYDGNLFDEITTVCCGWTSRGVAIGDGRVYLGKLDGKLVALDAKLGQRGLVGQRRGAGRTARRSRARRSTTTASSLRGSPGASSAFGAASPPTTPRPARRPGASTRFRVRARRATRHGRRTTTPGSTAAPRCGRHAGRRPRARAPLLLDRQHLARLRREHAARATTCSQTRSSPSTPRPASTGGTSSRCTTTSGTSTRLRRSCSST